MSVCAISAVWKSYPHGGSELLVALALADWSDDDGRSLHPSMKAIARKTRLSVKQARRLVHDIIAAGFLEVVGHHAGGNPGEPRHYRLRLDRIAATPPVGGSRTTPAHGRTPADGTPPMEGRDPSHRCPSTPPAGGSLTVIEPSRTVSAMRMRKPDAQALDASFDRFWSAYPKKSDKKRARKAWDKLNPSDELATSIVARVTASAASPDWLKDGGQFIPLPSTYINGRRWEDEIKVATNPPARRVAL